MKTGFKYYKQEWEKYLKDFPEYCKHKDGFTSERQKPFCYFYRLYKNVMGKPRKVFRQWRMMNNFIHLFNLMFNEHYPKVPLSENTKIAEKNYYGGDKK